MTTLLDMRNQLNRRTTRALTDDLADDLINEALIQLSMEADWPWLTDTWAPTSTGAATYPLPGRVRAVRSVEVDNIEWRKASNIDIDTQRLEGWTVYEGNLKFYPSPATTATILVSVLETESRLEAAGEEPRLPDEYTPAVIALATGLAWDILDPANTGRGNRLRERYENLLATMRRSVLTQVRGPKLPRVTRDYV